MTEVVLGFDGGAWNGGDDLIGEGSGPNLRELRRSDYNGSLGSTTPPSMVPAWLSMATGQNCGNLGISTSSL